LNVHVAGSFLAPAGAKGLAQRIATCPIEGLIRKWMLGSIGASG
jgi:hypothetical protein